MRIFLTVVAATLMFAVATPASADDQLGLSLDGKQWSSSIGRPLLSSSIEWVPGDSRAASFYARNRSKDLARLTIDLVDSNDDSLLDTGDFDISARATGGSTDAVSRAGAKRLVTVETLKPSDETRVDVSFDFEASSGNASRVKSADVRFKVTLTQTSTAATGVEPNTADVADSNGILPDTGAGHLQFFAIIGAIFLGAGIAVLASRKHRRVDHVPTH